MTNKLSNRECFEKLIKSSRKLVHKHRCPGKPLSKELKELVNGIQGALKRYDKRSAKSNEEIKIYFNEWDSIEKALNSKDHQVEADSACSKRTDRKK